MRWKTAIPGHGWSSPIAWGDRVFVTSVIPSGQVEAPKGGLYFGGERPAPQVEHRWMVYAIDFNTGKIAWQHEAHRGIPPAARHLKNTYASETPVTDGQRVYVSFGNVGLFAYDFSGKLLWSMPFQLKPMRNGWGTAASPVLHNGRLYFVNDNDWRLVPDGDRCRDGEDHLAGRAQGRHELVDAVHLAAPGPHRDRDHRHRRGPLVRP